jgi:hypothetical protein
LDERYLERKGSHHCICFMLHPFSFLHKIVCTARPTKNINYHYSWSKRSLENTLFFCSNIKHNLKTLLNMESSIFLHFQITACM